MKRGGASTSSGCATVAHALGISRYEVNQYTQVRNEPIPLYPVKERIKNQTSALKTLNFSL